MSVAVSAYIHTVTHSSCQLHVAMDNHHYIAHGYIHHSVAMDNITVFYNWCIVKCAYCRSRFAVHVCYNICRSAVSNGSHFDIYLLPLFFVCSCDQQGHWPSSDRLKPQRFHVTCIFCLRGLCCEKCAWRCTFRASFDPSPSPRHDGCCYLFSSGKLKNDKHNHFLGLGLGPKLLFCLTNEILRKLVHIAHIMLCQIIVPIAHAILSVVSRKNSIIVLPW